MEVVTGAFGYIGRYITEHLLSLGREVKTITTHPNKPDPFNGAVQACPYYFDNPEQLVKTLQGASTLYNTYWIRFEHGGQTYDQALTNTLTLFKCAKEAGVKKIVHISVTHASVQSDLPYYKGKGIQEQMLAEVGVPYAIVRPTLVFGKEDILVNNIAWMIRRFPVFPIFGSGEYRVRPVFVGDLAKISVEQASGHSGVVTDAVGNESFTYKEMVHLIASKLERRVWFINMSPAFGIVCGKIIGLLNRDVVLTKNELRGLMQNLLTSEQVPNGDTSFSEWLRENKETVGSSYSSELKRHFNWTPS